MDAQERKQRLLAVIAEARALAEEFDADELAQLISYRLPVAQISATAHEIHAAAEFLRDLAEHVVDVGSALYEKATLMDYVLESRRSITHVISNMTRK
jgi:hypothetical protein